MQYIYTWYIEPLTISWASYLNFGLLLPGSAARYPIESYPVARTYMSYLNFICLHHINHIKIIYKNTIYEFVSNYVLIHTRLEFRNLKIYRFF